MTVRIRPFSDHVGDRDYEALVAVWAAAWPDYPFSVDELKHEDASRDRTRHFQSRVLAEIGGAVVGFAEAGHNTHTFVPTTYHLEGAVIPEHRRHGAGGALYGALVAQLEARGARALVADAKESETAGVRFLERHGFREERRAWESRLDVAAFDFPAFGAASVRAAAAGVAITTLAAERARSGDDALRRAHALTEEAKKDVPSSDPATPVPFEQWQTMVVDRPGALLDAYYLAVRDGRYVGLSNLAKPASDATFLWQNLTAVLRSERGKGIAMALKLKTVGYAREHGRREIRTWNDTSNRPMLSINEAMGFVKQPVWVEMRKELAGP